MRNFIRSLIFAFPLVFSSVGATSEVKDNPVEIVETSLEDRVQNVDVPMLNNLVGKPEEGNVLSKLTDLFFEGESSINLRISRETLENYFYQSKNERILRTAEGLLENFYSIDISHYYFDSFNNSFNRGD